MAQRCRKHFSNVQQVSTQSSVDSDPKVKAAKETGTIWKQRGQASATPFQLPTDICSP